MENKDFQNRIKKELCSLTEPLKYSFELKKRIESGEIVKVNGCVLFDFEFSKDAELSKTDEAEIIEDIYRFVRQTRSNAYDSFETNLIEFQLFKKYKNKISKYMEEMVRKRTHLFYLPFELG